MSIVYYLYYDDNGKEECMHIPAQTELSALTEAKVLVSLLKTEKWMLQKDVKEVIAKNF